jgi:UDP:flavonoid glycosyltransferase YjiC (YdhE family)
MYPTTTGPANPIAILPQADSFLNVLSRPLLLRGFWYAYGAGMRAACRRLGGPEPTYSDFVEVYLSTPTFVAVSPPIIPASTDYPSHVHVTGFLFLELGSDWVPPSDLLGFLDAGGPPAYIGFGSVGDQTDEGTITLLVEALDGRRAIVDGGWSEKDVGRVPDSVYLLDGAPHDWLFPRMAALVHHGGSGTTAVGLRAGVPTVVIPHFFDQFYFGRRVHDLGVGPEPIPRHRLDAATLSAALDTVLSDDAMRARADAVGQRLRKEESVEAGVALVDEYLDEDR